MDKFKIGKIELPFYYHNYNCGLKGASRITERTIEIAIADYWLNEIGDNVIEIGAVTPYYYPERIKDVVDPSDKKATIKDSLFNQNIDDKNILCISTIEHFGTGEYGVKEETNQTNPQLALDYIMYNANNYLITWPWGVSDLLDDIILRKELQYKCNLYMFSRLGREGDDWYNVEINRLMGYGDNMANSIIVAEHGNVFN